MVTVNYTVAYLDLYGRIFIESWTEEIIWLHSHFCLIWKSLGATQSEISWRFCVPPYILLYLLVCFNQALQHASSWGLQSPLWVLDLIALLAEGHAFLVQEEIDKKLLACKGDKLHSTKCCLIYYISFPPTASSDLTDLCYEHSLSVSYNALHCFYKIGMSILLIIFMLLISTFVWTEISEFCLQLLSIDNSVLILDDDSTHSSILCTL